MKATRVITAVCLWALATGASAASLKQQVRRALSAPEQAVFAQLGAGSVGLPINIGYIAALGHKNTWEVDAAVSGWGGAAGGLGWSGLWTGVGGAYHWWIAKYLPGEESEALRGIFVGPQIKAGLTTWTYEYYDTGNVRRSDVSSSFLAGGGAEGGYQWMFDSRWFVAGVAQGGMMFGTASTRGGVTLPVGGTYYNALVRGGYAF